MYLAGNLKFLREQIGKTQQELANLFGVEQKTMSSWECGSRTPGIEIIVELARYHGVSLDDLVLRDMKPAMPVYVLNLMYLRKKHGMTQQDISELLNGLDTEVNAINSMVKEKQMRIGALQQKSEQIAKLKQDIAALQDKQVEYAKETADYDTLKVAFSQSGVPHQIIRSIIPQLTATANTILGQMTGGKMGVEFRLERLQKNGKEKVSLDIYIEEYGKSILP